MFFIVRATSEDTEETSEDAKTGMTKIGTLNFALWFAIIIFTVVQMNHQFIWFQSILQIVTCNKMTRLA